MDTVVKAGKEIHKVSAFVTDTNGHQHEIMCEVKVEHQKSKFSVKIAPLPSEVSTSIDLMPAVQALVKRANETGKSLIDDFQARTSPGGRQMTIFDIIGNPSGQTDDEDIDGEDFEQGESA